MCRKLKPHLLLPSLFFLSITEGKDVVTDVALQHHWRRYLENHAAFPTTTHFVERSAKVSNYCNNKHRNEERTSQFAICYNLVHDLNETTKETMIKEKEGKGKNYKNNDNVKPPRGEVKFRIHLQKVKYRHDRIETALLNNPDLEKTYERIAKLVKFDPTNSYKAHRRREAQQYNESVQNKHRKPNKIEREVGFDITPVLQNQVLFHGATRTKYVLGIEAEILARDDTIDLSQFKNMTEKKNELKRLVAIEFGIADVQTVKMFPIKSSYDWSPLLESMDDEKKIKIKRELLFIVCIF